MLKSTANYNSTYRIYKNALKYKIEYKNTSFIDFN